MSRGETTLVTTLLCIFLLTLGVLAVNKPGFGSAKYALVLGLDGLGAMYFNSSSSHPNLDSLIAMGSSSMTARDSIPTDSKPNWAAIFAGAGPEETGVDSNEWYFLPNCMNYRVPDWRCIGCATCEVLIPLAQHVLKEDSKLYNATIDVIEKVLHGVCDQLNFPLKQTCNTFVTLYAEEIFDRILFNQTATHICDELQVCRNQLDPLNGHGNIFPTMFKLVKYANPLYKTVLYTDHNVVVNLVEKRVVDYFKYEKENTTYLIDQLVPIIEEKQPELVFFHFDTIDHAGHSHGWGSSSYYEAIEEVDSQIGTILDAYSTAGILNETIILVTADHGGSGKGHGKVDEQNVLIPWIAKGPSILPSHTLKTYVRDMDIPATALHALGISLPKLWQGKPAVEAWTGTPPSPIPPQGQISDHVVVVVISGLTSNSLEHARTPTLQALFDAGSFTKDARTVMPATSLSGISSILMGAGPEETGICAGKVSSECSWSPPPAVESLPPTTGAGELFPSVFALLKSDSRGYYTSAFYNWANVSEFWVPSDVDYQFQSGSDQSVANSAASFFASANPNFTLVQFNEVQLAGQQHGYNSSSYYSAVEAADSNLKTIVDSLQANFPDNFLIVVSDHGGIGKRDGLTNNECILVPWVATGPKVREGFDIENYVRTLDTAALSAFVLNVQTPSAWIAKPPLSIFYQPQ